jgi:hypothetical protein
MQLLFIDKKTGKLEVMLECSKNSYLMSQSKLTERGIDTKNWFDEKRFDERFRGLEDE